MKVKKVLKINKKIKLLEIYTKTKIKTKTKNISKIKILITLIDTNITLICVICVDFKPHPKKASSTGNYDKFNAEAVCNIGSTYHDPHKAEPLLTECLRVELQPCPDCNHIRPKTKLISEDRPAWPQCHPPKTGYENENAKETDTLVHGQNPGKTNCAKRPLKREIYIYVRSPCLELISIRCKDSIGFSLNTCLKHFRSMYREILCISTRK